MTTAENAPGKSQALRLVNAIQWVLVAAIALLLALALTGHAPPQRLLMVKILAGAYVGLFVIGKWLEWKRGRSQASSPD